MITKKDFVEYIAAKNGISKKQAADEVGRVWGAVGDILVEGAEDLRTSFGTFTVQNIAEVMRRYTFGENKGEEYVVPAHKRIAFKASGPIRAALKK